MFGSFMDGQPRICFYANSNDTMRAMSSAGLAQEYP